MNALLVWIPSIVGTILLGLVVYSVWRRPNLHINRAELRKNRGSLADELRDCTRVWAIFHTCSITALQGILDECKIERLILTDPLDNYMMETLDPRGEDGKAAIKYHDHIIQATAHAHKNGAEVRF